jgi:hypothetical protein
VEQHDEVHVCGLGAAGAVEQLDHRGEGVEVAGGRGDEQAVSAGGVGGDLDGLVEVEVGGRALVAADPQPADLFLEFAGLGRGLAGVAGPQQSLEDGGDLGGAGVLEGEDPDLGFGVGAGRLLGLLEAGTAILVDDDMQPMQVYAPSDGPYAGLAPSSAAALARDSTY